MSEEDKKYLDDQCHKIDFMSIVQSIESQIKVSTGDTCSERKTVHPHQLQNVQFQNISILPQRRDWSFLGDEGFRKTKTFEEMFEAQLEFPTGWGRGGM